MGAQSAQNLYKSRLIFRTLGPQGGSEYDLAFKQSFRTFWTSILGRPGFEFRRFLARFPTSWRTLNNTRLLLLAGATLPRPHPSLGLALVVLGQIFNLIAKRIRELTEDTAENKSVHAIIKNIRPHNLVLVN